MKKKLLSTILACAMVLTMAGCQKKAEGIYTAGTYTASAEGMNGPVKVSVTVSESEITDIQVVEHSETAGLSDPAVENMPGKIKEAQSTEVDAEAGCTITSDAIKAAVAAALAQAKGEAPVGGDEEDGTLDLPFDQADVIIVGAGFAGLNASLAAVEAGAKVILIDKNSTTGGSIRYAGGTLSGAGTKMQAEANVVDTPEDFYNDIIRMGGGINVEELTRKHVAVAADAIDWMDSIGADFGDRQPTQPSTYDAFDIPREHRVKGGGKAMAELVGGLVNEQVAAGKMALLLNTEVADIIMDGEAVVGVELTNGTKLMAKSIILATGGYGHNEEWLHEYNFENVLTDAPEFVTGDGYNFAKKAGAVFSNMDYLPAYAGGVPVSDTGFAHSVTEIGRASCRERV